MLNGVLGQNVKKKSKIEKMNMTKEFDIFKVV